MKTFSGWFGALLVSGWIFGANADHHVHNIQLIPAEVYAPMGFDDNDNSQVVIDGIYPDSCYTTGTIDFRVDTRRKEIYIRNGVIKASDNCLMMLVPYTRTLDLGPLQAGDYKVYFFDRAMNVVQKATLPVRKANSKSSDEYLYAPVSAATVVYENSEDVLVLSGTFSNSCMSLKEVKVLYNSEDVIEVLPIADFKTDTTCQNKDRPFEARVKLRKNLQGKKLVHTRSLNGQSVNKIMTF